MEFDKYEGYDELYPIAFALYDCFNLSKENIEMATLMVDNVMMLQPNNYHERAVIATLSYFIDNHFKVVVDLADLNNTQLQPGIPQNWRNATATVVLNGDEIRFSKFIVRKTTQTFELTFSSGSPIGSESGSVSVTLVHTGNHALFSTGLHSSEVDGLTNPDRAFATGVGGHILKNLIKAMGLPVKRASKDQAPPTPASPF